MQLSQVPIGGKIAPPGLGAMTKVGVLSDGWVALLDGGTHWKMKPNAWVAPA